MIRPLRLTSLLLIKPPHATRLVRRHPIPPANPSNVAHHLHQPLKRSFALRVFCVLKTREERALPLALMCRFVFAEGALRVLDCTLVVADGVHVALFDGAGDLGPGAAGLDDVLLLEGCDDQLGQFHVCGLEVADFLAEFAAAAFFDTEGVGPLAVDGVEGGFFGTLAVLPEGGGEGVFLAGEPAAAGVIDFADEAGRAGDVGEFFEFDEGGAVDEVFDVEGGEGDEVGFGFGGVGWCQGE